MLANFFKKSKPVNTFALVILLYVYYLLSTFLLNTQSLSFVLILKHLGFFIWLVIALLIIEFIIKKNKLTAQNSYGILIAIFVLGMFSKAMFTSEVVFANLALLLSFRKIYSLKSDLSIKQKLFDAGFWIGVATLFFAWSWLFIALIYVAIFSFKKLDFRNAIIPLIGFIIPLFLTFTYFIIVNDTTSFYNIIELNLSLDFTSYNSLNLLVPITFIIGIVLWSVFGLLPKINNAGKGKIKVWYVALFQLLFATILVIISPIKNGAEIFFIIFPIAIFVANFIQLSKSEVFKNMILYLFLIISLTTYFIA
ncbi:MAG TPA: DUF6427 family protein [Flavobacteriaceae bacterium]|nr:DUF6427 family protein [Flavobacteriaceae bacterium]